MNALSVDRLERELLAVDLIIPELQRLVTFSAGSGGKARTVENVTLYATRHGDPMLSQGGYDVLRPGEPALVVIQSVADALGVRPGDGVTLTVLRQRAGGRESASTALTVAAVVPSGEGDQSNRIGYADILLLNRIEQFVRGFRVEEYGWAAKKESGRDTYSSYLLLCESGGDLSSRDRSVIVDMGFTLEPLPLGRVPELARLLKPDRAASLRLYQLYTTSSMSNPHRRLSRSPSEFSEATEADDVVIPWNDPRELKLANGRDRCKLVGLSLSNRSWLRSYFVIPELPYDYDSPAMLGKLATGGVLSDLSLVEPKGRVVHLNQTNSSQPNSTTGVSKVSTVPITKPATQPATPNPTHSVDAKDPPIVVVPANLLAYIAGSEDGLLEFDPTLNMFVPIPEPPVYDKARLYARDIDQVPLVVAALQRRNFAVLSENSRIQEIHQQDRSLQILVSIVGLGVFLFGVVVVVSVLLDSTNRKRGTLGILRVMGVSSFGIFYLVLVRAMVIGLIAGVLSVAAGHLIALALAWKPPPGSWAAGWKPVVSLVIRPDTIGVVALGAFLCCSIGSLIPAWWASRLDPFDAIIEGRFR